MSSDDRLLRRWVGVALGASLVLGACGSGAADDASAEVDVAEVPTELALDTETADDATDTDAPATDDVDSPDDFDDIELTPEMFEELKADEVQRAAVLEEMEAQGLTADEAECFLDNVSPGLFSTFGSGDQPDDDQFGELLQLLDTCEIAFGAES